MGFSMVVGICTEALLLVLVIITMMKNSADEIKRKRTDDTNFTPTIGQWVGFITLVLWLVFQLWKAWCAIQTLL